jgi:hypothetical protein
VNIEVKSNIDVNRPSEKNFGIVFSIVFLLIFFYLYLYSSINNIAIFSLLILSVFALLSALFFSKILYYPNYLWFKFGMLLSKIISPIIMLAVYLLAFVLFGLIIKLFKGKLLQTSFNKDKETYWETRKFEIQSMKNQF